MRSVSVDLNNDSSLLIDIPDALCERDKVKFTVHTKVKKNACRQDSKKNVTCYVSVFLMGLYFLNLTQLCLSSDHT